LLSAHTQQLCGYLAYIFLINFKQYSGFRIKPYLLLCKAARHMSCIQYTGALLDETQLLCYQTCEDKGLRAVQHSDQSSLPHNSHWVPDTGGMTTSSTKIWVDKGYRIKANLNVLEKYWMKSNWQSQKYSFKIIIIIVLFLSTYSK
jgi:hypothetical protein